MIKMANKKEKAEKEVKFEKADLLKAERYKDKRDLVSAVLPDNFKGTIADADTLIEKFMKGKVK